VAVKGFFKFSFEIFSGVSVSQHCSHRPLTIVIIPKGAVVCNVQNAQTSG